jgi:Selenoprotein SelK_SelG
MPYIGADGNVVERRSPWRFSIITDFFRGVYNFFELFLSGLVNPGQRTLSNTNRSVSCMSIDFGFLNTMEIRYSTLVDGLIFLTCYNFSSTFPFRIIDGMLLNLEEGRWAVATFEGSKTCKDQLQRCVVVADEPGKPS